MKKHEIFDNTVGAIIFFLMFGVPMLLWLFGWGDSGVQPLGKY